MGQDHHPELPADPALSKSAGNAAEHHSVDDQRVDGADAEGDPQGKRAQRHPDIVGNHKARQLRTTFVAEALANVGHRFGAVELLVGEAPAENVGHDAGRTLHGDVGHQGAACRDQKAGQRELPRRAEKPRILHEKEVEQSP